MESLAKEKATSCRGGSFLSQLVEYFRKNHYNGIYIIEVGEQGSYFATSVEPDDEIYIAAKLAIETGRAKLRQAEESSQ